MRDVTHILNALYDSGISPKCSVLRDVTHVDESSISIVTSSPVINLRGMFSSETAIEIGVSLVKVLRKSAEPLHFHSSHIVGIVTVGTGYLRVPGPDDKEQQFEVRTGDIVVIPRGAPHMFECEGETTLEYVAMELSDQPIDYQKHYHIIQ
jgi:quercetin dioxygenase-like cupin family protein